MKRRDFLKSVFGVGAGLVVAPSVLKAKEKPLRLVAEKVNTSLADEHLESLRRIQDNSPDGAYLKTSELKCMRCGYVIKLPSGYYELGTRVVCNCGNVFRFTAQVELKT